jgi:penicillin-binding protein 1A
MSKPRASRKPASFKGPAHPALRVLKWLVIGGLGLCAIGAAGMAIMFWVYGSDPKLPTETKLTSWKYKQTTRVVDVNGRLIGEIYEERRTVVTLAEIAPVMIQAMTSAEDKNFFEHSGIDLRGIIRAFWVNVTSGEAKQGASTITQQVVKTMLLTPERTLRRKVQEVILARRIEKALTKDEILTLYLNQIYFGHQRYGIEEAARYFFGKRASQLDVGEAALLAGLPQSPERLSPRKHPEEAKRRQTEVLRRMARNGHISEAEAQRWIDAPIKLVDDGDDQASLAPEVVDLVRAELVERHGDELGSLGVTVRTSIDLDLQLAARTALREGLAVLDKRHGYDGPLARLEGDKRDKKLAALKKALGGKAPSGSASFEALVDSVDDAARELVVDLGGWQASVGLAGATRIVPADKAPSAVFKPGDLVRVKVVAGGKARRAGVEGTAVLAQSPEGAVVLIDPQTRHVLALVGGSRFRAGDFDRALRAKRQPGSSFKPFVYAAAIESKKFTAATIVNDAPEVYDLWKPKNFESGQFLGPVRLRTAMAMSINTVAIRVLSELGPDKVVALAQSMGIGGELPRELSLALGSGEVTPLDLTNAFATFAAGGKVAPPQIILQIGDERVPGAEAKQVLDPQVAYVVTDMMRSVVDEGTAVAARKLKRQIAGKTGTSNGARDTWFVGFTPDLVAGVWIGFDDNRPLGRGETGGHAALPVWIDVMKVALKNRGAKTFKPPAGVVTARIDKASGKLAPPGAPPASARDEVFLDGTVPTEVAIAADEASPDTFMLDQMDLEGQPAPDMRPLPPDGKPARDGDDDTAGATDVVAP